MLQFFRDDFRQAGRHVIRAPYFSLTVIITLALAVGAAALVLALARATLLHTLPVRSPQDLVVLRQSRHTQPNIDIRFSLTEAAELRAQVPSLAWVGEHERYVMTFLVDGRPSRVEAAAVSPDYFSVLGVTAALGRLFGSGDGDPDSRQKVVLSHAFWWRHFGGDPGVVGKGGEIRFQFFAQPVEIVGILPRGFDYPEANDLYVVGTLMPSRAMPMVANNRTMRTVRLLARVSKDSSLDALRGELTLASRRMAAAHPSAYPVPTSIDAALLHDELTREARPLLAMLTGTSLCVFLLALVSVGGLLIAQLQRRRAEFAVRVAVGASHWRLASLLIVELSLLSLAAAAAGLALAYAGREVVVPLTLRYTPLARGTTIDPVAIGASVILALLCSSAIGLLAALSIRRGLSLAQAASARRVTSRTRSLLLVGQIAVATVLLSAALLMTRSVARLMAVPSGIHTRNVLALQVGVDWQRYKQPQTLALFDRLLSEVRSLPGVLSAGAGLSVPMTGGTDVIRGAARMTTAAIAEGPAPTDLHIVTSGFFETLGVPVLAGRDFDGRETPGSPPVAIVNQTFARQHMPSEDPQRIIGRGVRFCVPMMRQSCDSGPSLTIVGVVGDARQRGLDGGVAAELYQPLHHSYTGAHALVVRTGADPKALAPAILNIVREADPLLPVFGVQRLDDAVGASTAPRRFTMRLLQAYAALALIVGVVGIAGGVSYDVSAREREFGVRLALGARAGLLQRQIVGGVLLRVAAGLAAGLFGATFAAGVLRTFLWEIGPRDPGTLAAALVMIAAVATAAAALPAFRIRRIDPVTALHRD